MVDEVVGGNTEVSEKLFSPIKKNYLWIFFTSIYFILLAIAYSSLKLYFPNRIDSLFTYHYFFNISPIFLLFIIGVSISISIFAYRSFPKSLMFFGVFFGVFSLVFELFWLGVFLAYLYSGLIEILVFGVLLRGFTRIKMRWLKMVLALMPFLVIFIVIFIVSLQGQSYTLEDCAELDFGLQWNCYMKFALQENNISICSGKSFDGDCIRKVLANSNGNYPYAGECDSFERKDVCYLEVARGLGDYTLCEKMSTPSLRDSCGPGLYGLIRNT